MIETDTKGEQFYIWTLNMFGANVNTALYTHVHILINQFMNINFECV